MKFRIGYGGPKEYRHGRYFPGGRANNGGMTEIERLIHLIASMQILFGSRRGGWVVPVVLIGLCVGGWFLYRYNSADTALEQAHAMYDSSDTDLNLKAISEYKRLLQKSDPIEPGVHYLLKDRDRLYRRIIQHEVLFAEDEIQAFEWTSRAWDEGFTQLTFDNDRVAAFWSDSTDKLKGQSQKTNRRIRQPSSGSRFQTIPGVDH